MLQIDKILELVVDKGASDLHISVGSPPVVRLNGKLRALNTPALTAEDTQGLMKSITSERAQQELAETARVFGLSAEDFLDEPRDPIAEAVGEVKDQASRALASVSEQLAPLTNALSATAGKNGPELEEHGSATSSPNRSLAPEGLHHQSPWQRHGVMQKPGHQGKNTLGTAPQGPRPRPRLRRSAAPPRAVPALEDGEGEHTLARSLAASEKATGSPAERLPIRQVERKARTVQASALPSGQKVTSAIAPPSAPLAVGQRASKAIAPEVAALAAE